MIGQEGGNFFIRLAVLCQNLAKAELEDCDWCLLQFLDRCFL